MTRSHALRRALLAGAGVSLVACKGDTHLVSPTPTNAIFESYVAIGNSITSGYQSGGINDSTQQRAYPVLLARQMATRFAYPSLTMPGCPPPVNNLLTQSRVSVAGLPASTAATCFLRNPASVTGVLNNVAVPGIETIDPTAVVPPNGNSLTQLFLGGESMIQKALDAKPTFATVWVGNNDILEPAVNGLPGTATPVATFITNYAKDINQLVAGAPNLKGVLIAVVQVANVPLLFSASLLRNPTIDGAASQVAGRLVTLDPVTCTPGVGDAALVNFAYIAAIAARSPADGGVVYCNKVLGGGQNDPGDNGILDVGEQALVTSTVNAYNAYIKAKADSIGFAYYDPNPTLLALKASGAVPPFPNLASTTQPFGQYFSLDGVHPTAAAHILVANDLIGVINTKYGTSLATVPTS